MKRFAIVLCLFIFVAGCGFLSSPEIAGEGDGVLKCPDVMVLPGAEAKLYAQFKSVSGFSEFEDQKLQLLCDGKICEEIITDHEGEAVFHFTPPQAGDYCLTLRVASGEEKTASPIIVFVCARPADVRIIVTDIDHTISDASGMDVLKKNNAELKTMNCAVRCLTKLSSDYTIIYVTGREDFLAYKTRNWLDSNGFPPGPLYSWNARAGNIFHRAYKASVIKNIKTVWPNIVAGVGDLQGDADAYDEAGIPNIFIIGMDDEHEREEFPAKTKFISRWSEVIEALAGR